MKRLSFLMPCCLSRKIESLFMKKYTTFSRLLCILLTVFVIGLIAICLSVIRDTLISTSIICSSNRIINTTLKDVCSRAAKEKKRHNRRAHNESLNLCSEICSDDIARRMSCHIFHLNKQTVFTLNLSNKLTKVVVKSIVKNEEEDSNEDVTPENLDLSENTSNSVDAYLRQFLGEEAHDLVRPTFIHTSDAYDKLYYEEFWQLIYDHEYLMLYLFQKYDFFPKIMSVCEYLYAVEYAKPLTENPLLPYSYSWKDRLLKSIDILKYLDLIDRGWKSTLNLCDIKHDHFGWTENGKVVFLDLDAVMTDHALKDIMINTPDCENHEDCSFFDCQGYCQVSTKKCLGERSNTNLQVVCNKIFMGNSGNNFIPLAGLLVSSERDSQLSDALEICSTNKGMSVEALIDVLQNSITRYISKATL